MSLVARSRVATETDPAERRGGSGVSEHTRHTFIADSACECGLMVSELVIRQQRQIKELEREREANRAAIRALAASIPWLITIVRSRAPAIWSGWGVVAQIENRLKEHAAALARATGQEGAR